MENQVFPKLKSPDFKHKEVKNVYLFDLFLKKGVILDTLVKYIHLFRDSHLKRSFIHI